MPEPELATQIRPFDYHSYINTVKNSSNQDLVNYSNIELDLLRDSIRGNQEMMTAMMTSFNETQAAS